ncbi:MAG: condensation domain-containing protein, partial [Anaerolineae bacterium]
MNKKNIADFYPLSPMQQGMLFHSLAAPDSGVYVEQVNCLLQGDFDETAFIRAWEMVMQRHPILRTGFLSAGVKEPVQLVYKQVTLPVVQEDWQALTTAEQESKLDAFTAAECVRGFDLSQPPLLRLALLKMAADAVRFVWTFHHILMDGWSLPILLQEVFAFYEMLHAGKMAKLPPTRPFRDYIIWLKKQNVAQAAAFWRKTLAGFTAPTPLSVRSSHQQMPDNPDYREVGMALSREQTAVLQSLARQHQLTLNTFVQGAWALLLHRYSGEADVLFGATVSGRPPGLPGSEMMVGLFINTLPVRVQIDNEQPVLAWLKALQANQLEQRQYEFSPLIDIQGWSDVPRGLPLFESILVFENYPIETVTENSGTGLTIADIRSVEQTNYPLTVVAGAADALHLRILYDCTQFTETAVSRMLDHLQNLLTGMADDPTQPVKNLPLLTAA